MSDITTNLKKLYDISRCKSMRQFAKLVNIDQSNLQKKMASNNYTKTDVQKNMFSSWRKEGMARKHEWRNVR
jgi:phage antirepressor YoqD-like protein